MAADEHAGRVHDSFSGWLAESLILPAVAMPHFILGERQTVGESSAVLPTCTDAQAECSDYCQQRRRTLWNPESSFKQRETGLPAAGSINSVTCYNWTIWGIAAFTSSPSRIYPTWVLASSTSVITHMWVGPSDTTCLTVHNITHSYDYLRNVLAYRLTAAKEWYHQAPVF